MTFAPITNDIVAGVPLVTGFEENDALTPDGNADILNVTSCGLPTTVRVGNTTDGCEPCRADTDTPDNAKSFPTATVSVTVAKWVSGVTPLIYQPDLLDPVGRVATLSLRKVFQ